MIAASSLIYEIDLKLNKLSSLDHQAIPVENKIIALNEAQIKLVKIKLNPNNTLQLGFEANKKRYQDLEVLIESAHKHPLTLEEVDDKLNKWSADIEEIKPQFMFYVDAYILADKKGCKDNIIYVNNDLTKHGDVTVLLNNSNYKPSFEYQETFCTFSGNFVEVYTDGSFTPKQIFLSYIRYPRKIDFPGYIRMEDGKESVEQDSELPDYLKDELINLTIQELGMSTENIPATQLTEKRVQTHE